jgi:hypothetical protein
MKHSTPALDAYVMAALYPDSMGTSADLTNQGVSLNTSGELLGTGCWEFTK